MLIISSTYTAPSSSSLTKIAAIRKSKVVHRPVFGNSPTCSMNSWPFSPIRPCWYGWWVVFLFAGSMTSGFWVVPNSFCQSIRQQRCVQGTGCDGKFGLPLKWFPQNKYSKYMEPLELILQKDMEIFGLPVKHLDPKLVDVAI